MSKIVAVCISKKKGTSKKNIRKGMLRKDYGFVGDAHAGKWHRQVSLLAKESLEEVKRKGVKIGCGGFGENITTEGIELTSLIVGTPFRIGRSVLLEITQIGKECKRPCAIYKDKGLCILPSQGIFAKVSKGGEVKMGDKISIAVEKKSHTIPVGILTISDSCWKKQRKDESGKWLSENLSSINGRLLRYKIVPDEQKLISKTLKSWADDKHVDVILTTGGTGLSVRDCTPEATRQILDKEASGIQEMLRKEGAKNTKFAYLSRGVAGMRKKTLIINLPGSLQAVKEGLKILRPVLPHAVDILKGKTAHQ